MLKIGNKDVSQVRVGSRVVTAIYVGARLVWSAISSCFGSGWWINDKPWRDNEGWKN
ncbi:MFS transporter [Muribaculum intestinale]|jgi:hypothetical protein|nr:MFS transporter [Muribaculum intestinale]DAT42970.1 MAG TPA: hypothetical protein [Caudoviricetes sp.]